jgi:hypothetical protein
MKSCYQEHPMQHQEGFTGGHEPGKFDSSPKALAFVPKPEVAECKTFRDACHLAWVHRTRKNLTFSHLAVAIDGLYASHASEYFAKSPISSKGKQLRDLPAKHVAAVQRELGNYAISQWLARMAMLTLMEEVITRGSL